MNTDELAAKIAQMIENKEFEFGGRFEDIELVIDALAHLDLLKVYLGRDNLFVDDIDMTIDFKEVADALRKYSEENLADGLEYIDEDDEEDKKSMTNMYEGDNDDCLAVAALIEKGSTVAANVAIMAMDTSPREGIAYALAKDSPAYYVTYLEPLGWSELKHMVG